jgi:hypothetical protein
MRRCFLATAIISCFWQFAAAQIAGETRTFELTPAAPPVPVLKYHLLFEPAEQTPGNAAPLYRDAASILGSQPWQQIVDFESHKFSDADFTDAAESLYQKNELVYEKLEAAGRCEGCDWKTPIREKGNILLPYLNTTHTFSDFVRIRAREMLLAGKIPEALGSLRLGYELSRKTAQDPFLVTALTSQGAAAPLTGELEELMNRPDAPNLYWALAALPRPFIGFHYAVSGERLLIPVTFKEIAGANLDDFSGDDLRPVFQRAVKIRLANADGDAASTRLQSIWQNEDALDREVNRNLPAAQQYYEQTRNVSADQVQSMEPFKVTVIYWYEEMRNFRDEIYAASTLPYPLLIPRMRQLGDELDRIQHDQPANSFILYAHNYTNAATAFCRTDRQLAALTDVEAIRSYAAANGGRLPDHLQDITDTPALDNPRTGEPFDYAVHGDTAALWDSLPTNYPLEFTIRIRK